MSNDFFSQVVTQVVTAEPRHRQVVTTVTTVTTMEKIYMRRKDISNSSVEGKEKRSEKTQFCIFLFLGRYSRYGRYAPCLTGQNGNDLKSPSRYGRYWEHKFQEDNRGAWGECFEAACEQFGIDPPDLSQCESTHKLPPEGRQ
jgi:hypothetical protein